uniref:Uncharacterized protein n=1 Tax=Trichuris muris TaxID=70415 RepID=A0A5S6QIG4_TRIMR
MSASKQKRNLLEISRSKPPRRTRRGVTSTVGYRSLIRELLAQLLPSMAAIKETSEAHEQLLKELLQSWTAGKNDFNEFTVCAPSSRGQLYYVERRLREEREQRRRFLLSDFYTMTVFCKSLLPPSKCLAIQAKNKNISSMKDVVSDIPAIIQKGKELYADRAVGIRAKHEAQIKKQKDCVNVIRKLLAKEHDYVNILCVAEASIRAMKRKGKQYLDKTTPDVARDFRRIFDRYVSLYMQQRQHGINPTETTLNEADGQNRTRFVAGKSGKLEEIRAAMENVAARIVPPGIQIKELSSAVLLRAERIAKVDQLPKPTKDSFSNFAKVAKSQQDIAASAKQLFTLLSTCLVSIIKELMPKLQEITEKRGNIQTKLNGLAEHIKIKRQECRPHKKLIKHFHVKVLPLRKELASLSHLESTLRMKLIKLVQHLAESEDQLRSATNPAGEGDDTCPLTQEELTLHQEAIEKVRLHMSCIETEVQLKDLEDLINRKRCHLKLQLAHIQKQASYTQDEQESRSNTLEMYKRDNDRLQKYVSDNEAFLKKVDEAIEKCSQRKEVPEIQQKQLEALEKDCDEVQEEIEKLIRAPDQLYSQIRQLEHELDSIKNRCREKRRNFHKLQVTAAREREMHQDLINNRQRGGQFPALIEKDLKAVDEEVKALQIKFDQVFNTNIEMKGALIEQESIVDRCRRSIARLETDIAMADMETDEINCHSKPKALSKIFDEKFKFEKSRSKRSLHETTSPQEAPTVRPTYRSTSPEKQPDISRHSPPGVYQEEVNIRRTFTIHSPGSLPMQLASKERTQGYEMYGDDKGAAAQNAPTGAKQSTLASEERHEYRRIGSPSDAEQKGDNLKELLTSTKIPDQNVSQAQSREDLRDSPEYPWVSYTDGRDIPTVLKTDVGLDSLKMLRQTAKKSRDDVQQGKSADSAASPGKTAGQEAEQQNQQKSSKPAVNIPDGQMKTADPKSDPSVKTPTNTDTMNQ